MFSSPAILACCMRLCFRSEFALVGARTVTNLVFLGNMCSSPFVLKSSYRTPLQAKDEVNKQSLVDWLWIAHNNKHSGHHTVSGQKERNLSTHLDLSSAIHQITQNRPEVMSPLRRCMPFGTSDRDPAVHTDGAVPARAVTMPYPTIVSCPCIRGSVLS